ncbi:ANTAR domain-containing protein [Streptomyces durbertensis]|uniref:ANTAR domain-containing protein n=1 Tax=Streptomyces durbertensis TaxID=2448886 RepID=A0ABR6EHA3_9ACTN|nr:ANTAR domain-containing protein [Streptomyces durbertensis]MBB1244705.1 ANTAR domain-containing protein [Streptomyces durbertensis]
MQSADRPDTATGEAVLAERVAQLEQAVESHAVIDQAVGVVMALGGCGCEEAFRILRDTSQDTNTKLRLLAEEVTGWAEHGAMDRRLAQALSTRLPRRRAGAAGLAEEPPSPD